MSFTTPREKISAIMKSLEYVKVKDAFDFQNIGNTKILSGFHIEQGTITPQAHNQGAVDLVNPQTIRFYRKGNDDTTITMTQILTDLNTILNNLMAPAARVDGVRSVTFSEFSAVPHSDQGDHIVRGELVLNYNQTFCFTTP